jgi:hypothetical protein
MIMGLVLGMCYSRTSAASEGRKLASVPERTDELARLPANLRACESKGRSTPKGLQVLSDRLLTNTSTDAT